MSAELTDVVGFAAAAAAVLIATPVAIILARRTNFYDHPREYRQHGAPTPLLGGVAVLLGVVAAALAVGTSGGLWVALGCGAGLCLLGVIDDRIAVAPRWRIVAEAGAGVAVLSAGLGWDTRLGALANLVLTVFWVVALVNAFNLMDNLDGACTTVTAVAAAGIGVTAALKGQPLVAAVAFGLAGACVGFLPWNLAGPAKIFLGDGGSMPVGFLIAVLAMATARHSGPGRAGVLVGALLVGLPILDVTLVSVSRIRRGVSLMRGGRDHLTHRILLAVRSPRRVAGVLAMMQATLCALAVVGYEWGSAEVAALAFVAFAAGVFAIQVLDTARWRPEGIPFGPEPPREPIGVLRVIARLNIGGPAIQAITLTKRLEERGYQTTLVRGREGPVEGNMDPFAEELGVQTTPVRWMGRDPSWRDAVALLSLIRLIRRERPSIVHTHAAKGGTLGRLAAVCAFPTGRGRPLLVHTYHGHSLAGYFSPRVTAVYRGIEQILARFTACLVAVSTEVRDELLAMRVAPESKFEVVPLGFDLAPFRLNAEPRRIARDGLRDELGLRHDDRIVTLIARCVPIKRVDRFLRLATALRDVPGVRFLVVGDGELRAELQTSPEALALGGRLVWAGFRSDIPDVCFASDVVVLTSDNEGTPVSLIEAQAAGTPVVSTDVGGVATVIRDGETGFVVDPEDEQGMADLVARLLADPELAARLGAAGAHHAMKFTIAGLVERIDDLYQRLLGLPAPATVPAPAAADAEPQPVEI